MQLYSETGDFKLYQGSMLDMLEAIAPCSVDAIVTDPPYELGFMGKGWDNSGIAFQADTWRKCYQVLKTGGYLLAFGGSRTFHRIACAIEDAGFEIRDTIMWLYGSGFPKSMNIGKAVEAKVLTGSANTQEFKNLQGTKAVADNLGFCKQQFQQGARPNDYTADGHYRTVDVDYQTAEGRKWDGWGTALKPAYEPIIVARKPCEGSCVDNILMYGTGGLNIDGCRIGTDERSYKGMSKNKPDGAGCFRDDDWQPKDIEITVNGRFPSNVLLTYDETDQKEVCGGMPEGGQNGSLNKECYTQNSVYGTYKEPKQPFQSYGDSGSAARYFYCAKASKRDRDEGLELFETKTKVFNGKSDTSSKDIKDVEQRFTTQGKNTHPTVKPVDLMQYLVRLVTPPSGTVLDPFNGSGSTGKAAMYENKDRNAGYKYIGIELTAEYLPIADARIRYAAGDNTPIEQPDIPAVGQITIFDVLGGENGKVE